MPSRRKITGGVRIRGGNPGQEAVETEKKKEETPEERQARVRAELIQDYFITFGSESGRRVYKDLFRSYVLAPSYVAGSFDATAWNEGAKSVFLKLRSLIREAQERAPRQVTYIEKAEEEILGLEGDE